MNKPQTLEHFCNAYLNTTSRIELWLSFLNDNKLTHIAEVGVWKGEFAEQLLNGVPALERYYMIDPWAHLDDWNKPLNVPEKAFEKVFDEAMSRTALAEHRRIVLRGRTSEVMNSIEDQSLDFAYIDGDHTLRGITLDLHCILPKVKAGGFIAGDDFTNTPWQHDEAFEPTMVFPYAVYFAEMMGMPVYALPHSQFLIHVDVSAGYSFTDITGDYESQSLQSLIARRP